MISEGRKRRKERRRKRLEAGKRSDPYRDLAWCQRNAPDGATKYRNTPIHDKRKTQ